MGNTLGLDDDMDPVEIVWAIEKAFGIQITDEEARGCRTVGDIFDVVKDWFAKAEGKKCATAMAFYRLRKGLEGSRRKMKPETALRGLHPGSARVFFKELADASGVRCPDPGLSWVGYFGLTVALSGLASLVVVAFIDFDSLWWLSIAAFALGLITVKLDPGIVPRKFATLGDLSEKVAALNFGRLAGQGARANDRDIWNALVGVVTEFSALPASQITRETWCLKSQLKGSAWSFRIPSA
ncbi:MAG: acyl carrier protein [Alphaproteobacteria bacterium]